MAVRTTIAENIVPLLVRGRGMGGIGKEKEKERGSMTMEGLGIGHPRLLEEGQDLGKDGNEGHDK